MISYCKYAYLNIPKPSVNPVWISDNVVGDGEIVVATATISGVGIAKVNVSIGYTALGEQYIISECPALIVDPLTLQTSALFNNLFPALTSGANYVFGYVNFSEPLDEERRHYFAEAPIQVLTNGTWVNLKAYFILQYDPVNFVLENAELVYVFTDEEFQTQVKLTPGNKIRAKGKKIDVNGNVSYVADTTELTIDATGLTLTEKKLPVGSYIVGFTCMDLTETEAENFTPITIQ